MRYLLPVILMGVSLATFFAFVNPTYKEVQLLRADSARYDEALTSAQQLQAERDALNEKYRNLPAEDLERLNKLLPDNVDNIRLIINLQQMAQTYGMAVSSVKFDAAATNTAKGSQTAAASAAEVAQAQKDYGVFDLEFTTSGSYQNFQKFLKDIESSLRVTDIQSVGFTSDSVGKQGYTYTIKLKTYWLKST